MSNNIFFSKNPVNLQVIAEYKAMNESEVMQVLDKSHKAFLIWSKSSFNERRDLLTRAAVILRQNKEEYARLITNEMGKIISEARAEVEKCAGALEYYANTAEHYLQNQAIASSASYTSYVRFDPIGVIFAIMPWNYPFWQVIRYLAPCLMSGNVSILKHAPNVFGCGQAIEKLFIEAGAAEGVFQSLIVSEEMTEKILSHDAVQGVTLTGSEKAGSIVASIAAKHIKKSVLELGGSDPFIVLADADIDAAVKVAAQSRMMNAGQACICAKRFIVEKNIKEEFEQKFLAEIKKINVGNPLDENIQMGPMARIDLAQKLEHQIKQSIDKGATILTGAERDNCFLTPALVTNISKGMAVYDEEIFGPVASLIIAQNEQDAIAIANNSRYGLGAALWTKNVDKAQSLAPHIQAGCVFVNALVHSDPRLPFGGIKKSGYGRELSEYGIKEFMNIKTVYINK